MEHKKERKREQYHLPAANIESWSHSFALNPTHELLVATETATTRVSVATATETTTAAAARAAAVIVAVLLTRSSEITAALSVVAIWLTRCASDISTAGAGDIAGLGAAILVNHGVVLDRLGLSKRAEALRANLSLVDEDVLRAISGGDESETLLDIEPFDLSCFACGHGLRGKEGCDNKISLRSDICACGARQDSSDQA